MSAGTRSRRRHEGRWSRRNRFLQFYNFERPHLGYRTKGRTPAEVFWGAVSQEVRQEV